MDRRRLQLQPSLYRPSVVRLRNRHDQRHPPARSGCCAITVRQMIVKCNGDPNRHAASSPLAPIWPSSRILSEATMPLAEQQRRRGNLLAPAIPEKTITPVRLVRTARGQELTICAEPSAIGSSRPGDTAELRQSPRFRREQPDPVPGSAELDVCTTGQTPCRQYRMVSLRHDVARPNLSALTVAFERVS